jgi:hypothetical protein
MLFLFSGALAMVYADRPAKVAQLVEHTPEKRGVVSSILTLGTFFPKEKTHSLRTTLTSQPLLAES